jgi:hypothetical protein
LTATYVHSFDAFWGRLTKGEIKYARDTLQPGIQRLPSSDAPSDVGAAGAYSCKGSEQIGAKRR